MIERLQKALVDRFGAGTVSFLHRLGWMTIAFGLAKVLTSVAAVLAGRTLGEAAFGHATLVTAGGTTLGVLFLAGINGTVNVYVARDEKTSGATLTACMLMFMAVMLAGVGITLAYPERIGGLMRLQSWELPMALLFAVVYASYTWLSAAVQGLHLFNRRAWLEFLLAIGVLGSTMVFLFGWRGGWVSVVAGLVLGYTACLGIALAPVYKRLRFRELGQAPWRELFLYTGCAALINIGFLYAFTLQRIQVDQLLHKNELGQYQAYTLATINIAAFLSVIIQSVLVAKVAASSNRHGIWLRGLKAWALAAVPVMLGFVVLELAVFRLMRFQFRWDSALWFALAAVVIMAQTSLNQVVGSTGLRGAMVSVAIHLPLGVATYVLTNVFVKMVGLNGTAFALIAAYGVCIGAMIVMASFALKNPPPVAENA